MSSPFPAQVYRQAPTRCGRILALAAAAAASMFAQTLTPVVFQSTSAVFPNPDRGFYTWTDLNYLDYSGVRAQGHTLTRPYFRLDAYRNSPLPQAFLAQLNAGFEEARRVGIKVIPRFSYNFAFGDPDASSTQILLHLQQLGPVLAANEDVISLVEAGFIGAWGEWHSSTNGSDSPFSKSAVANALMSAVPLGRMIAIRYPADLRQLQLTGPITAGEAFTGTFRARLGSHQDCFLASPDDWGTWGVYYDSATQTWKTGGYSIAQDKAYIAQNAAYAPVGGETCNVNPPRSSCPSALADLAYLQWSYLNLDYEPNVIQGFRDGGCFDEINRRLGYRFELTGGSYTGAASQGGNLQLNIQLINRGFAAMFNARPVFVVLRDGSQRYTFPLTASNSENSDPRYWAPGVVKNLSATLLLPAIIPPGTYTLALWMPDQALSIQDNPLYAVRFANQGIWDAARGDNVISGSVTIQAQLLSSLVVSPASVVGGSSSASNRVNLIAPAPPGGLLVMLSASNPAAVVPASVSIPQGATSSAMFTITTTGVAASTPVTITATYGGSSKSGSLTINPAVLSTLTAASATVVSGRTVNTTVILNGQAPAGGTVVAMTSSNPAAAVPATATVAQGATSVVVPVTASFVAASTSVTISAAYGGVTRNVNLSVLPIAVSRITSPSATVISGKVVNTTVTLNGPAPIGGAVVTMTSSNPAAAVPATATVAQGATLVVVPVRASYVAVSTPVTISAAYGGVTRSVTVSVLPTVVSRLTVASETMLSGKVVNTTVTLNGPAPTGGAVVTMTSSNPAAAVPATATVAQGATTVVVPVSAGFVTVSTPVTISAAYGGVTRSVNLLVLP